MTRRRSTRRRGRRSGGDGVFPLIVGLVVAVPLANAAVGFVRTSWPWLLAATLAAAAVVIGVALLAARRARRQRDHFLRANARLEAIDEMTGERFEHLVAELLRRDGFRKVSVIGKAGDGGVDVVATAPDGGRFAVQCKRWSNNLGSPHVRNFLGALAHAYAGHTGVLVTSSGFTPPALREGRAAGLSMIDRGGLAEWALGTPLPALLARPRSAVKAGTGGHGQ
ncbi:restriction endonuclease [Sphaerisporangium fuscum]|uniref:restriction endonuclease n=1 Tax=Sphaerisporangium fuscum TaxID=2835868 RepID=UPI001BDD764C|nr:restriction endonuclease [Sphaerisporangium fuscum]